MLRRYLLAVDSIELGNSSDEVWNEIFFLAVDGDGVANELDALPFNSGETSDGDGDGIGDNED